MNAGIPLTLAAAALCLVCAAADYPREGLIDTSVHPDEALTNVTVAASRWPDCTTLESAIRDIFRIEGVADKSDQDKAFALWKWFRILVSATGGYEYEGPKGKERIVLDPHKILTVYGHHQCDGQSWAYVSLWRAAGFMALDECTLGHTIAALRYRDPDGQLRYHDFDPQGRFYYWDDVNQRVGTWTVPVFRGRVHRHVMQPQSVHSLRTSLRWGETVERRWDNAGHVLTGRPGADTPGEYYLYREGRRDGVYAAAGEEVQSFTADLTPERFALALDQGSENMACSAPAPGKATLHPTAAGVLAVAIYRLPPPYVVTAGQVQATLIKGAPDDTCRLSLSVDGGPWRPLYEATAAGEKRVDLDLGRDARTAGRPDAWTAYDVRLKFEFSTAGDIRATGLNGLRVTLRRQLNKRTLPTLRPGENVIRVTADRMAPGLALHLALRYRAKGREQEDLRVVRAFPHYFRVSIPAATEHVLKNYDKAFNIGDVQMEAVGMRLVDAKEALASPSSLAEAEGQAAFARPSPHPADLHDRKVMKKVATDIAQVNGFLPQSRDRRDSPDELTALLETFRRGSVMQRWVAAEDLGNYPQALDTLLEELPKADIDLTVFIVKALAQIGDKKAVPALLAKWKKQGPGGAPGTRYIPDCLAVLGDRSVVPDLVAVLPKARFDFRLHIAHALGLLGGPLAEETLKDLAANDPFPPVRDEAREGLRRLGQP